MPPDDDKGMSTPAAGRAPAAGRFRARRGGRSARRAALRGRRRHAHGQHARRPTEERAAPHGLVRPRSPEWTRAHAPRQRALRGRRERAGDRARRIQPPRARRRSRTRLRQRGPRGRALLDELLPDLQANFYLCGPPPFMGSLLGVLAERGVSDERIHTETIGPSSGYGRLWYYPNPAGPAPLARGIGDRIARVLQTDS